MAIWEFTIRKPRKIVLADLHTAHLGSCGHRIVYYTRGGVQLIVVPGGKCRQGKDESPLCLLPVSLLVSGHTDLVRPAGTFSPRACKWTKADFGKPARGGGRPVCGSKSPWLLRISVTDTSTFPHPLCRYSQSKSLRWPVYACL